MIHQNHSLNSAISEINSIIADDNILFDGQKRKIDLYLSGEYKFLLMAMGTEGAHPTTPVCGI